MTNSSQDLLNTMFTPKKHIQTPNGDLVSIKSAGTVNITPNITLKNCLYLPKLSHKLLSISQLTKELNCTVLMTSNGCIVQDARTGKTIGHGTERDGLYYVDEGLHQGTIAFSHKPDKEKL